MATLPDPITVRAELRKHVHCAECGAMISTEILCKGGKTTPAEIHSGVILRPVPHPEGVGFIEAVVPLCDECHERIRVATVERASRLLVPESAGVPDLGAARKGGAE